LVTLSAHSKLGNQASNRANALVFNSLDDIIAYGNGASNGASNGAGHPAIAIISEEIHDRVAEMLTNYWTMKRADLFEKTWI
jgi:hypothetical protein